MPAVIAAGAPDWLEVALRRDYHLERELARFEDVVHLLARDRGLDRSVELLVLDRAVASDARTGAFLEWAQLLARVTHPNITAVHRAGVVGGVPCVVMEHLDAPTLSQRLILAALPSQEVFSLARDLLRGLEASHAHGIARPGLTAETVVCASGRTVITTRGRMLEGPASVDTDLEAAAATIYRAATGRHWSATGGTSSAAWSDVPRRLRPLLRRALSPSPEERWHDAGAFRRELERIAPEGRRRPPMVALARAAVLMALGAVAWQSWPTAHNWLWPAPPGSPSRELAVVPFEGAGGTGADTLGLALANMVEYSLDNLPRLELKSWREVVQYWERNGRDVDGIGAAADLRVHWATQALLSRQGPRGDSLRVRLTLYDATGARTALPEVHGTVAEFAALADTIAVQLLRAVAPDLEALYAPLPDLAGVPLGALKAFFQGEAAFARDAWSRAATQYEIAIDQDPTFALARWRLANLQRWTRFPSRIDLSELSEKYGDRLRPLDRAMLRALLEPDLELRLARLDSVVATAPRDPYARFLYAEELFHRGPLVGRDLEYAARVMGETVALDSSFAEAYNHLFFVSIREGRRADARKMLELRRRVALVPDPGDPDVLQLLRLAYDERFVGWRAALKRRYLAWRSDSAELGDVARVARLGLPWFDLPKTQIALNRILLDRQARSSAERASALAGIGLGVMAMGRPVEALAQLDSAAELLGSSEARLQQAEWRAVPPLLGLPRVDTASDRIWTARLEQLADDPALAPRAHWALAVQAFRQGDTLGFERARAALERVDAASPLGGLLRAIGEAARGHAATALAISDSIRPRLAVNHPADPFAGAVFHLLRADWLLAAGERQRAEQEWAWYEGSDFEGWPSGLPQASEIEATFGALAGWKRGAARLAGAVTSADTLAACQLLLRTTERWVDGEPAMAQLQKAAARDAAGCRR